MGLFAGLSTLCCSPDLYLWGVLSLTLVASFGIISFVEYQACLKTSTSPTSSHDRLMALRDLRGHFRHLPVDPVEDELGRVPRIALLFLLRGSGPSSPLAETWRAWLDQAKREEQEASGHARRTIEEAMKIDFPAWSTENVLPWSGRVFQEWMEKRDEAEFMEDILKSQLANKGEQIEFMENYSHVYFAHGGEPLWGVPSPSAVEVLQRRRRLPMRASVYTHTYEVLQGEPYIYMSRDEWWSAISAGKFPFDPISQVSPAVCRWYRTVPCMLRLLDEAYRDGNYNNQFFAFLSGSHIPVEPLGRIYENLTKDPTSRLMLFHSHIRNPLKHSQWVILNRKHARLLLDHRLDWSIPPIRVQTSDAESAETAADDEYALGNVLTEYLGPTAFKAEVLRLSERWNFTYVCWNPDKCMSYFAPNQEETYAYYPAEYYNVNAAKFKSYLIDDHDIWFARKFNDLTTLDDGMNRTLWQWLTNFYDGRSENETKKR